MNCRILVLAVLLLQSVFCKAADYDPETYRKVAEMLTKQFSTNEWVLKTPVYPHQAEMSIKTFLRHNNSDYNVTLTPISIGHIPSIQLVTVTNGRKRDATMREHCMDIDVLLGIITVNAKVLYQKMVWKSVGRNGDVGEEHLVPFGPSTNETVTAHTVQDLYARGSICFDLVAKRIRSVGFPSMHQFNLKVMKSSCTDNNLCLRLHSSIEYLLNKVYGENALPLLLGAGYYNTTLSNWE